eukprot:542079_1
MAEIKHKYNMRKRKAESVQGTIFYDENGNPYIWICCNDDECVDDGIGCDYVSENGTRCLNWTHMKHSGLDQDGIKKIKTSNVHFYCKLHANQPQKKRQKINTVIANDKVNQVKGNDDDTDIDELDEHELKKYTENVVNEKQKTVPEPVINIQIGIDKIPRKDTLFDQDREKAISNKGVEVGKLNYKQIGIAVDMLLKNEAFRTWMSNELLINADDKIKSPLKRKKKVKGQGKGGGIRSHWNDTYRTVYVQSLCYVWKHAESKFKCSRENGRSAAIIKKTNDVAMILFEKLGIKAPERPDKKIDEFFCNLENYKHKDKEFVIRYNNLKTDIDTKKKINPNDAPSALANSIMQNMRQQNYSLHKKLKESRAEQKEDKDMTDIRGCVQLITKQLIGKNANTDDVQIDNNKNGLNAENVNRLELPNAHTETNNNKYNKYEVDNVEKEFCLKLFEYQKSENYNDGLMMKIQCGLLDPKKKVIILSRYNMYKEQCKDVSSVISTIKPVILAMEKMSNMNQK